MAILSEGAKARVGTLINVAKTAFHWGFMPTVLYLGFQKGSYLLFFPKVEKLSRSGTEPGMPELTLASLLWA